MDKWNLVIVMLTLAVVSAQPNSSSMFKDLPQGEYSASEIISEAQSGLKGLFNMAEGFINIVFLPFSDLAAFVKEALGSPNMMGYLSANWQKAAKFQSGFIACLVFGFLFIIFVPLIGSIVFICRCCCSKCGGHLGQSQARSNSQWRQGLSILLLLLTIFMAVPMMLVFVTNSWITGITKSGAAKIDATLGDMLEYFELVPRQISFMANEYGTVDDNVRPIVKDFGSSFGIPLRRYIKEQAQEPFSAVNETAKVVDDSVAAIDTVGSSLSALEGGMGAVDTGLANIRNSMASTLNTAPVCLADVPCKIVSESTGQLAVGFDLSQLSGLRTDLIGVRSSLTGFDLHGLHTDVTQQIDDIPTTTLQQTRSGSLSAVGALNQANSSISQVSNQIPTGQFDRIDEMVSKLQATVISSLGSYSDGFDKYRYIGGALLGSILLFIVGCYLAGLLLGIAGHDENILPTQRGPMSNLAGILLVIGSGLSIVFSSLFMILVMVLFTLGGHGERYLCQGLSGPNYQALGLVEEIANISIGSALQLPPGVNLSLESVMKSCEQDESVYEAFKLKYLFNVSGYLVQVSEQIKNLGSEIDSAVDRIDLSSTEIYSPQSQRKVRSLSKSGMKDVDFQDYLNKLGDGITQTDLTAYAAFLRENANKFTNAKSAFQSSVLNYADRVMDVQNNDVAALQDDYDNLKRSINLLIDESAILGSNISSLDAKLVRLNNTIQGGGGKTEVKRIAGSVYDQLSGNLSSYIEWAGIQVSSNIGACRPVYEAYTGAVAVLCDYLMDTINGLWFSLGWAAFLLVPSAIIAMKLMKFFRKMSFDGDSFQK